MEDDEARLCVTCFDEFWEFGMKSGPEKRLADPAYAAVLVDRPGRFNGGVPDITDELGRPAGKPREAEIGGCRACFDEYSATLVLWNSCTLEGKFSFSLACTGLRILPSTIVAPKADFWAFRAFSV